jgi:hypothetical protein
MDKALLDLYSDYLISSFSSTTATGLSALLNGQISHDQITRFLAGEMQTGAELWRLVKPLVREIESEEGVLIIDDSIEEKSYTDENEIICWHWDHAKERNVKGINFITALYHSRQVSLPVTFVLVAKTESYADKKSGKTKRRSPVSKNEHCRQMLQSCKDNQIPFRFVLMDIWFASAENMRFIKHQLHKEFILPLKENRKVALSLADKLAGRFVRVDQVEMTDNTMREVYLESVDFPLILAKQLFKNGDGSHGVRYLVSSETTLDFDQITTIFRKRWKVEEFHQSLKQNASLAKSPTRTVTTQTNHFFAALSAYIKLEMLKVDTTLNHFALKSAIYIKALQTAFRELKARNPISFAQLSA